MRSFICSRGQASIVILCLGVVGAEAEEVRREKWVTAWATSQQELGEYEVSDATVRMIARVTSPGVSVRLRLDNTYGQMELRISGVSVGLRMRDAALVPSSNRSVRFAGLTNVTIPPGGSVRSDPIEMRVLAYQDLAISIYVPGSSVRPSQHRGARVTSYLSSSNAGDVRSDESGSAFIETTASTYWLKSIDVLSDSTMGTVVAFGDSITDGSCVPVDGYDRWADWLGIRLNLDSAGKSSSRPYTAIVNEGIGGNTVTFEGLVPPPVSTPGVRRLERDVFSHSGVTHVILFMGTNDLRREATAQQVIAGMEEIISRVKDRELRLIGVTIIPRHDRAAVGENTGWNSKKTKARNRVNEWIRSEAGFDAVLDFDASVRDSNNPDLITPAFDCDGIHPSPRGYYEMATSVPLELFRQ